MPETLAPPSTPLMTAPAPEPDDIPDPVVPAAALAQALPPLAPDLVPMLHGFCQHLQTRMHEWMMDEHRQLTKGMDVTLSGIRDYALKVLQCNEHAEYQLSDALLKIREDGLKLLEAPYTMQVQVRNQAGIPIVLTVRKQSAAELLDELTRLEAWLQANGYTAGQEVAF